MLKSVADSNSSAQPLVAIRSMISDFRRYRLPPLGVFPLLAFLLSACSGGGSDPVVVSDSPTAPLRSNLTIEPASFILTEGEQVSLQAKLGNTVMGASQVTWSVSPSKHATVDAYGNVTATKHGEATVTARYTSITANASATVWAIPDHIEVDASLVQAGIVGRPVHDSVGVTAVSKDGVPVPGVDVSFQILSGEGILSHQTKTTGLDGVARVDWILGTGAGDQTLRAQAAGLGEVEVLIDALPDYDSATVNPVAGDEQEGIVTDVLPEALRAQVTDQFGNVLPGLSMEWTFTDGGGLFGGTGTAEQVLVSPTDHQGITEILWQLGTLAGEQEATCSPPMVGSNSSAGSLGGNGPSTAPSHDKAKGKKWRAKANPADPDGVVVTPEETMTVVGRQESLNAAVVDQYGNEIEGNTFQWEADGSGVIRVNNAGKVTGLRAGTGQVTAASNGLNLTGSAVVVVETRKASRINRGSGNAQTGKVGETLAEPVRVRVLDQVGDPVPGIAVQWTVPGASGAAGSSGGAPFLNSGQPGDGATFTDLNGVTETDWTLGTQVGDHTLQALVDGVGTVQFTAEAVAGPVVMLAVEPTELEVDVGETRQIAVSAQDAYGNPISNPAVQWESSEPDCAIVSASHLVTGLAEGSLQLLASVDGVFATVGVTVNRPPDLVRRIEIAPDAVTIQGVDEFAQLSAVAFDSLGAQVSSASFDWTSLNPSVATVSQGGVVTSKALGQAMIVASVACCTATDTVVVQVEEAVVAPGDFTVEIDPATIQLVGVNQTTVFSASVHDRFGEPVEEANVLWSSVDPSVATVSTSGVVTSTGPGQALIVASAEECCEAADTALVEVSLPEVGPGVTAVQISPEALNLEGLGGTGTLAAAAFDSLGASVPDASFEWTSLDPDVASVDGGGVVTPLAYGQAFIVASAICCAASDTIPVNVVEPTAAEVAVSPVSATIE
ncbi:MAG: hypothetical protein HKO65_13675, partial [Gemmatimonadetes bacterium]|nr:hypothetical protein [Gemmatimonadota bacterium]